MTFEGEDFTAVMAQIVKFVAAVGDIKQPEAAVPYEKPTEAEARRRREQMAKARAARGKKKAPEPSKPPKPEPEVKQPDLEDIVLEQQPEDPEPEISDPVQLAAIRVKTTEDLQAAYSNGKHKQVLALLAKFGNGAKSFRELQIKDFVPIRKAIDEGALA